MKEKLLKWAYGLLGGCIGGGASAAVSWLGMAGAKAAGLDVPALNLKAIGVIFLSGVISNGLLFLKQSPLPPLNGDTAPPFKPPIVLFALLLPLGLLAAEPLTRNQRVLDFMERQRTNNAVLKAQMDFNRTNAAKIAERQLRAAMLATNLPPKKVLSVRVNQSFFEAHPQFNAEAMLNSTIERKLPNETNLDISVSAVRQ